MLLINLLILYIIIISLIILISNKYEMFDNLNVRKIHKSKTLNTGGISIFIFYLFLVFNYELNHNIELIISIGFFICLLGFIDDRINLSPSVKIITIALISTYLIINGINIYDLGKYEYIGLVKLGKFQIPFLILATGLLINAVNYIDGIDGLLLTFFISCLGYYLFLNEDEEVNNLIKLLLIPAFVNLIFNFAPGKSNLKIFSGNSGSLFVGFFISFLTIEFYNSFNIHPVYLIWPLWYPVYDFLFVSYNRLKNKKSIFMADNTHFHHVIFKGLKNNHLYTTISFFIINFIILYLSIFISNYSKILSLTLFIVSFILYCLIRIKIK
jgi:UDP-GlcNAc:undecaprenyl-phosphate GlcNAc-1-phosphate transferase